MYTDTQLDYIPRYGQLIFDNLITFNVHVPDHPLYQNLYTLQTMIVIIVFTLQDFNIRN